MGGCVWPAGSSTYCRGDLILYVYSCLSSVDCTMEDTTLLLTAFLGTCPGWQDKMTVCGLQDELPMRMVADKGEVGRD